MDDIHPGKYKWDGPQDDNALKHLMRRLKPNDLLNIMDFSTTYTRLVEIQVNLAEYYFKKTKDPKAIAIMLGHLITHRNAIDKVIREFEI